MPSKEYLTALNRRRLIQELYYKKNELSILDDLPEVEEPRLVNRKKISPKFLS